MANEKTDPILSPSVDSSFAKYPIVYGSINFVSIFLETYPNVGLLDIFLFYNNSAKTDPDFLACETPTNFLDQTPF